MALLADRGRRLRADPSMAGLQGRSIRGGAVTLAAQGIKLLLQLASTVVLARLLTLEDFGLVAMVTAVTGFIALFEDLGLSQATVQRPDVDHSQVSTLFWINIAVSVALMLGVWALSPLLPWVFGDPRLADMALVVAVSFLLNGLGAQHLALLTRHMRYERLALIDIASLAAGIVVALAMAYRGYGYWSLIAMPPTQSLTRTLLAWIASDWRPGRPVLGSGVRPMLSFGGNLAGFNILNYFSRNADNALIGWYWGASALGIYSRAYYLMTLPLGQVNAPLLRVVIPTLSRLQNAPDLFRQHYLAYLSATLWLTLPVVAFLAGCAPSVVLALLGPKWLGVVDVFRILCITAALQPLYNTIGWIFISKGRADRFLRWAAVSAPLFVLSFALGLPWGVSGVALAYSIAFVAMLPATMAYALRDTEITPADLWRTAREPALFGLICFLLCSYLDTLALPPGVKLCVCAAGVAGSGLIALTINRSLRGRLRALLGALRPSSDRVSA